MIDEQVRSPRNAHQGSDSCAFNYKDALEFLGLVILLLVSINWISSSIYHLLALGVLVAIYR